jgi:hypothetical protein
MRDLAEFIHIDPRLPSEDKTFVPPQPIKLTGDMTRDDVMSYLQSLRGNHPIADLAFYAYRDLSQTAWEPFIRAAIERNPVAIEGAKDLGDEELIAHLEAMPNESIYDGPRLAQPDEVWNYGRGDGLERALCLANIWKSRHPDNAVSITADDGCVHAKVGTREVRWPTGKGLEKHLELTTPIG